MINLSYYEGALTARVNKFTSRGKMGPESVPNPLVHSEEGDGGPGPSRRPTVWSIPSRRPPPDAHLWHTSGTPLAHPWQTSRAPLAAAPTCRRRIIRNVLIEKQEWAGVCSWGGQPARTLSCLLLLFKCFSVCSRHNLLVPREVVRLSTSSLRKAARLHPRRDHHLPQPG